MTKILIPVEEKSFAEAQIDFLGKHEVQSDAEITILAVIVPMVGPDYGIAMPHAYIEAVHKEDEKYYGDLVAYAEKRVRQQFPAVKVTTLIETGRAPAEILQVADDGKYDWIVMGSHGRSGFERFFLGSVSLSVVSHAHCSVSIVRLSQDDKKIASAKKTELAEMKA